MTYAEVASHFLRLYATEAAIGKADMEIRNYQQGLLTPLEFFNS